jgi:HAD superfamily hydrolase (TIGR01549 family)
MDGTLTLPQSNFIGRMRRELGVADGVDVLAYTASLNGEDRLKAEAIIKRIEDETMLGMKVQPGLIELIEFLEKCQLPKAILTRNNQDTVNYFLNLHESHRKFNLTITRDFTPPKPAPDPLLHIAKLWNIQPEELLMVGDHSDDLICAKDAGSVGILLLNSKNQHFQSMADLSIHRLDELIQFLQNGFTVERVI